MRLYGIIGKPLDQSPSPKFYNALFKNLGLECRYLPFQVEKKHLKNLVLVMKLVDVYGLNVTIPYKEAVIPFLDGLDQSARLCGAVNTIVRKKNRFIGYNTDGIGFLMMLKSKKFNPRGKIVSMIGAGGAARGIATALADAGAKEIFFFNRHRRRAQRAAAALRKNFPKTKWKAIPLGRRYYRAFFPPTNLLIQTTPVSLKLPLSLLAPKARACDIRLNKPDGRSMFRFQAKENFRLWMGRSG